MTTKPVRRTLPAVALVAAGLVLTACGPHASPSAAPTSPASSASSAPGSPSAPAAGNSSAGTAGSGTTGAQSTGGPATSGTAGSGGGGALSACATGQLKVGVTDVNNGAGHTMFELVFQNTGTSPCTLHGYPGVSFADGTAQLGRAAERDPSAVPVTTVTLIPQAHAYADAETDNGQSGYTATQCGLTDVPSLRVYPPGQTASATVPWHTRECVAPTVQNLRIGPVHSNR